MALSPFDIANAMYTKEELPEQENPCSQNWMVARVLSMVPQGIEIAQAMNLCGMDKNPDVAYALGRYLTPKGRPPRGAFIKKPVLKLTPKQKSENNALQKMLLCNTHLANEARVILEREGISVAKELGARLSTE